MEKQFDIPVVLFIFKREKVIEVINRIAKVKPKKIYLMSDQGRNAKEKSLVESCRKNVEKAITWDCEIVKNYALENRGVYKNIGEGAKWVLSREKWAIFLEDDNLPEISFFQFCSEMLEKYEKDSRILWVCGTNYLGKYKTVDNVSYMFTRHMLPCGWASWGEKFNTYYDGELKLCKNEVVLQRVEKLYCNRKLYLQYRDSWMSEYKRICNGKQPASWDFQMDLSIKANSLFGICPCNNQIKNIGVDEFSTHGGTTFENEMTKRFCGMESYPMHFPLKHPETLLIDPEFEEKIGRLLLYPWKTRIKIKMSKILRRALRIPDEISLTQIIKGKLKNEN